MDYLKPGSEYEIDLSIEAQSVSESKKITTISKGKVEILEEKTSGQYSYYKFKHDGKVYIAQKAGLQRAVKKIPTDDTQRIFKKLTTTQPLPDQESKDFCLSGKVDIELAAGSDIPHRCQIQGSCTGNAATSALEYARERFAQDNPDLAKDLPRGPIFVEPLYYEIQARLLAKPQITKEKFQELFDLLVIPSKESEMSLDGSHSFEFMPELIQRLRENSVVPEDSVFARAIFTGGAAHPSYPRDLPKNGRYGLGEGGIRASIEDRLRYSARAMNIANGDEAEDFRTFQYPPLGQKSPNMSFSQWAQRIMFNGNEATGLDLFYQQLNKSALTKTQTLPKAFVDNLAYKKVYMSHIDGTLKTPDGKCNPLQLQKIKDTLFKYLCSQIPLQVSADTKTTGGPHAMLFDSYNSDTGKFSAKNSWDSQPSIEFNDEDLCEITQLNYLGTLGPGKGDRDRFIQSEKEVFDYPWNILPVSETTEDSPAIYRTKPKSHLDST
ncbi:hypothetical protein GW915_06810 [bacterium]|nr:hypothetical protein [bacterium]